MTCGAQFIQVRAALALVQKTARHDSWSDSQKLLACSDSTRDERRLKHGDMVVKRKELRLNFADHQEAGTSNIARTQCTTSSWLMKTYRCRKERLDQANTQRTAALFKLEAGREALLNMGVFHGNCVISSSNPSERNRFRLRSYGDVTRPSGSSTSISTETCPLQLYIGSTAVAMPSVSPLQ